MKIQDELKTLTSERTFENDADLKYLKNTIIVTNEIKYIFSSN